MNSQMVPCNKPSGPWSYVLLPKTFLFKIETSFCGLWSFLKIQNKHIFGDNFAHQCYRMIKHSVPFSTTVPTDIYNCLTAVWTDEIKHGQENKESKVERKWTCSMEKPSPTQLSGPAPSLPVPTKHWFPDLIFCLLLSPSSLFEQQRFLIYKTKTYARVCVSVCGNLFLLFRYVFYPSPLFLSIHTYTHTTCSSYVSLCVCPCDPTVTVFFLRPPPMSLYPSPHPRSLWQRGLPQSNDDFARCICDCHGNSLSVVAVDMEINGTTQNVIANCMERSYVWKHCSMRVSLEMWGRLSSCQKTRRLIHRHSPHVKQIHVNALRLPFKQHDCSLATSLAEWLHDNPNSPSRLKNNAKTNKLWQRF